MPELKPYRGRLPAALSGALPGPDAQPYPTYTAEQLRGLAFLGSLRQGMNLPRGSLKRRAIMTIGLIWVIGGFLLVGGFLPTLLGDVGPLSFFRGGATSCLGMVVVILGAAAIWVGGSVLWDRIVGSQLDTPILDAERHPVKPGQSLDLAYTQPVKRQVQIQAIDFRLIRRETATYTSGTDSHTVTHDETIAEESRGGRPASQGHMLDERLQIPIPADAMHTFLRSRNQIQYFLTVKVRMAGWLDFFEQYEIEVEP